MNEFKNDRFAKRRGGGSKRLRLACAQCGEYLLAYQKDGPGGLLRLYADRIAEANPALGLGSSPGALKCPCNNLVGVSMVYQPENRPAYRLVRGSYVQRRD